MVQVLKMNNATNLADRAQNDTLLKQYIYNMAISIDNCFEDDFTTSSNSSNNNNNNNNTSSGNNSMLSVSSYNDDNYTSNVNRNTRNKVFELQSRVDDLNIKLSTSGINALSHSSVASPLNKSNLLAKDFHRSNRKTNNATLKIDELCNNNNNNNSHEESAIETIEDDDENSSTTFNRSINQSIDISINNRLLNQSFENDDDDKNDNSNSSAKESSLNASFVRIQQLNNMLENEYEEVTNLKRSLKEKELLFEESLQIVNFKDGDSNQQGEIASPKSLKRNEGIET